MSLYKKLVAAGVPVSNHHSDLYFPVTKQTQQIVDECLADGSLKSRPRVYSSNITGEQMYDATFQFEPYWTARESK